MTVTGLGAITSSYGHLNGVQNAYYGNYGYAGGYYGYGYGGVCGTANAERAKERIANNYEVNATHQGYMGKQGVESINYSKQCEIIAEDLKKGQADQASEEFKVLVEAMKNSPQYENYSDSEICSLIREQYSTATGSDIITDINENTSNAFVQGFKRGIPIFGLIADKNSSADLVSQATNNNRSRSERASRVLGTTLGAATGTGAAVGTVYAAKGLKVVDWFKKTPVYKALASEKGKTATIIIGAVTAIGLVASLIKNYSSNGKTKD